MAKKELAKQGILGFLKKFRPKPKPKPPKKDPKDSFVPAEVQPILSSGKEIIKKVARPGKYSPATKQSIGKAALYGGVPAFGLYKGLTGGDDEETKAVSTFTPKESREVETSDRLGDILRERTMTIAAEAGRATPVFFDYVKAFPSSYMEKVGRDPEFAKQMMAGFLAMMKPVAGPVPVNPFVAFGEAAMAEGVRQEGEIPDQLKLIQSISEDPELSKAFKKFQRESTQTPITQRQANAAAIENIVKEELYGKDFKDKDKVISVATGNELSKNTLLEMYYDSGEDLGVLLEKVAASDD
jgi:hypothetical protein